MRAFCLRVLIPLAMALSAPVWADVRPASPSLQTPFGKTAQMGGGGIAVPGDWSSVDVNPATLGITGPEYAVTGAVSFDKTGATAVEGGVWDSASTFPISSVFKARQTQTSTGGQDRRFTLGLADPIEGTSFVVGAAGDFLQIREFKDPVTGVIQEAHETWNARFGLLWVLDRSLWVGGFTDGWLSHGLPHQHGVGAAADLMGTFRVGADFKWVESRFASENVFGTVLVKDWLDFTASYGYELENGSSAVSAGVVVRSEKARLTYSWTRNAAGVSGALHTLALTFKAW